MIDQFGNVNISSIVRNVRKLEKSVNDTLYYCFESIDLDNRLKISEALSDLRKIADELEQAEDNFFNS